MTKDDQLRLALDLWLKVVTQVVTRLQDVPERILSERTADLREVNLALDLVAYRAACRAEINGVAA